MTREQKKKLRLQIGKLLDKCDGCEHIGVVNIGIRVCKSCPLGQQIQQLGKMLYENDVEEMRENQGWWTEDEIQFLIEQKHMPRRWVAEQLNRSVCAVNTMYARLKKRGEAEWLKTS